VPHEFLKLPLLNIIGLSFRENYEIVRSAPRGPSANEPLVVSVIALYTQRALIGRTASSAIIAECANNGIME